MKTNRPKFDKNKVSSTDKISCNDENSIMVNRLTNNTVTCGKECEL